MIAIRILVVALGAWYIIGIGIFQVGLKGPIENRLATRLGLTGARIIYAVIGAAGIIFVATGLI